MVWNSERTKSTPMICFVELTPPDINAPKSGRAADRITLATSCGVEAKGFSWIYCI